MLQGEGRILRGENQNQACSGSPGSKGCTQPPQEGRSPAQGGLQPSSLSPSLSGEDWAKERSPGQGHSALRELDDSQGDPEDGLMQVTCM